MGVVAWDVADRPWVGADVTSLLTDVNRHRALRALEQARVDSGMAAAAGVLAAPGADFIRWVVRYLQSISGMAVAFVGEVWGADRDRVRTVAVCRDGALVEDFEYDLRGTPCANVIAQNICAHPMDVASIYPDDELLAEMGIEAYVGLALTDDSGAAVGLIVLLDTGPISSDKLALAVSSLDLLRDRVRLELSYHASLWSLEAAISGTTGETLETFVAGLARALHVRCALVGRFVSNEQVTYPVIWSDGVCTEIGPVPRSGAPAAWVQDEASVLVARGAKLDALEVARVTAIPVESYCAYAVRDREGNTVGLIALLHDRELPDTLLNSPILRAFYSRIGAELLRFDAEEKRNLAQRSLMEAQRREGLGTMAGGIAHDFNNLLVGILGNADLLLLDADESTRESCELIIDAANQASALCRQLLVYAGKGSHVSIQLDLNDVIASGQKMSTALIPAGCRLEVLSAKQPAVVEGDPVQIQQLVLNLVKNAGDAVAGSAGEIRVSVSVEACRRRHFRGAIVGADSRAGTYCHLSVQDNGCGMTPELMHKVFDPFFSTKQAGHGLGLATGLGVVKRHRGAMLVSSTPDRGTRFDVYFPQSDSAVGRAAASETREVLGRHSGQILLIDDDAAVLRTVSGMLGKAGFSVICESSGASGVATFASRHESIACVIVDLSMPGLDGGQVLGRLREIDAGVPVVLSTGFPEESVLQRMPVPPDAILMKPFEVEPLVRAVAQLCGKRPVSELSASARG